MTSAAAVKRYRPSWSAADIEALGTRTDVPTAGAILAGLSPRSAYVLAAEGKFPVPVIKVGRRLVVPVEPIRLLLGLPASGADIRSDAADQERGSAGEQSGDAWLESRRRGDLPAPK